MIVSSQKGKGAGDIAVVGIARLHAKNANGMVERKTITFSLSQDKMCISVQF